MTVASRNILKLSLALLVFGAIFFVAPKNIPILQSVQAAEETPAIPRGNENAVEPCDILDPNCQLPGQESLFPAGSEGEQFLKDLQNTEQTRKTQSVTTLANGQDQRPYFCGISVTCYIVEFLDYASSALLRGPLVIVSGFLDQAVVLALNLPLDNIGFVVQGWKIIRDVSNMFYVLILLWVALGTIFDFPRYNIREILPKLVISALLINFSLPLGMLAINTTNALANVFYKGIVNAGTGINGEGKGRLLADKILENTDFVTIVLDSVKADVTTANENTKKIAADALEDLKHTPMLGTDNKPITDPATGEIFKKDCSFLASLAKRGAENATLGINVEGAIAAVFSGVQCRNAVLAYEKKVEAAQTYDILTFARISAIIWKLILIPTLIFILFAAALFILIRTISLAFLLIFGPFVFLAMALPDTRQYWTQWWDKLLKWSFFFPILMFMLFLSITMMTTFTGEKSFTTTAATQQVLTATAGKTGLATPNLFTANMHFLFMMMLLLGSLTVADKMGIEMAGQVRSLGKRAYSGIKRTAKKPVAAGWRASKLLAQRELGKMAGSAVEQLGLANLPGGSVIRGLGRGAERVLGRVGAAGAAAGKKREGALYGYIEKLPEEEQLQHYLSQNKSFGAGILAKKDKYDLAKILRGGSDEQINQFKTRFGDVIKADILRDAVNKATAGRNDPRALAGNFGVQRENYANDGEFHKAMLDQFTSRGVNFNTLKSSSITDINSSLGLYFLKNMNAKQQAEIGATKEGAQNLLNALKRIDGKIDTEVKTEMKLWETQNPARKSDLRETMTGEGAKQRATEMKSAEESIRQKVTDKYRNEEGQKFDRTIIVRMANSKDKSRSEKMLEQILAEQKRGKESNTPTTPQGRVEGGGLST